MAYTTGQLVTDVQNRLDDTGFSSTILKQFLNDTQREITNGRFFRFMEGSQNYTLNVGTAEITNGGGLPTNYQTPILLRNTYSGYEGILPYMDYTQFRTQYAGADNATDAAPRLWYEYAGSIYVYPAPDVAYTVTMDYLKKATELALDADVPQVPEEWRELMVLGTYKRALEYNDDFDLAQAVQFKFEELLLDMTRRLSGRQVGVPSIIGINRRSTRSVLGG